MATPEVIEQIRRACVARLFSGRDDASWEEIRDALQRLEAIAAEDRWGVEKNNLANFLYAGPPMPMGAEAVIKEKTGYQF